MKGETSNDLTFALPEIYCKRCGELIPETMKDKSGHSVPLLCCVAYLPAAEPTAPKRRAPKPGIGSMLDDVPAVFIGRNG